MQNRPFSGLQGSPRSSPQGDSVVVVVVLVVVVEVVFLVSEVLVVAVVDVVVVVVVEVVDVVVVVPVLSKKIIMPENKGRDSIITKTKIFDFKSICLQKSQINTERIPCWILLDNRRLKS